jgi:hypothetical protein
MFRKQFGRGFGFGSGAASAGGGELDVGIITTVAYLPGIPSGTNFPAGTTNEQIWQALLAPYVKPSMSSLAVVTNPNDAILECGHIVTIVSATWSIVNDSEGNPPQNMAIAGDGFNFAVTGTSANATPASTTFLNAPGSKTWTLSGEDKNSVALTPVSYLRAWRFRYWFGAVSTANPVGDVTATALALSLQQSQLLPSRSATFTCTADNDTAGQFTWIVYPASFGALTNIIQNGALPVLGAFTFVGAFNVTNAFGVVVSCNFYKSNADKAFASGTVLAIS